ncbi:hypothetical protein D3C73_987600 [compost metagenome]
MHGLAFVLHCLEMALGMQRDPVQVIVIQRQTAQGCAGRLGQLLQRIGVKRAQQRPALRVQPGLTARVAQHAGILRARRQHQHLVLAGLG